MRARRDVNLTAPSNGTYAGILVFQDPSDTSTINISGGSNTSFNGAIYAPAAPMVSTGGSGSALDADLDVKTLNVSGGGSINSVAIANFGSLNVSVAKVVE